MNVQIFIILLTACSIITSILTEGVKQACCDFKIRCIPNLIAAIIAIIVGTVVMLLFYEIENIPCNTINSIYVFGMIICNWLGATLGYDKVKQTVQQLFSIPIENDKDNDKDVK